MFKKEGWINTFEVSDMVSKRFNELDRKVDALAKELGYTWESEAVKGTCGHDFSGKLVEVPFLKWSWKKIKSKSK